MIDSWCNMLGAGLEGPGQGWDTAGTAEVVGVTDNPGAAGALIPGLTRLPFVTNVDVVYGVTQSGCDSFEWFTTTLGEPELDRSATLGVSAYALLDELAATSPVGAGGVIFLPYLEGERSPIVDARASAVFFGLRRGHQRADLARAVLEGVAMSVRHVLEAAEAASSRRAVEIVVTSGGSKSRLWNQIKADVTGRPYRTLRVPDAGSVGAALLAMQVAHRELGLAESIQAMVHPQDTIEPRAAEHEFHSELYESYRALYPALAERFRVHHAALLSRERKGKGES
jgi:xylulokinase